MVLNKNRVMNNIEKFFNYLVEDDFQKARGSLHEAVKEKINYKTEMMIESFRTPELKEEKWIQKAIKRPGALTRKADKNKDGKLSGKELDAAERKAERKGDTRTEKQVHLARTLRKMNK